MKYKLLIIVFVFISNSVLSQEVFIKSKAFNQDRKIFVSLPEHYDETTVGYPVIYVLDGQILFNFSRGLYQYNSDKYPPAIIVGIEQVNRDYELVEQHEGDTEDINMYSQFSEFFLNELMPYIDSAYRTNSIKIFIGHSHGGLFLLNKMVEHADINNCICISPTVWMNDYAILERFKSFSPAKNTNYKLYLGYGENDFKAISNGILKLSEVINRDSSKKLSLVTNMYGDEDHNSAILIGMRKGLDYFFKDYIFPEDKWDLIEKTGSDSIFFDHFNHLSVSFGCEISPCEDDFNQLGYYYLESDRITDAINIFATNVKLYPYSSNAYDSYGEALLKKNDLSKALEYFQKALSIEKKDANNKDQLKQYQTHISQAKEMLNNNNKK